MEKNREEYGTIEIRKDEKMEKKKEKRKIENARSMKFALLTILVLFVLYFFIPEEQQQELQEVIPSVHETQTISLTDDLKEEYSNWMESIHTSLGAITTTTLRDVTDSNKLKFMIIQLKNNNSSNVTTLENHPEITCVNKDTVKGEITHYFATAFSDTSIPTYVEGTSYQTPFQTDTNYCYQVTEEDTSITLPTTLNSMTLDKTTNLYTLTFMNEGESTILTVTLKVLNDQKLIQGISYL